MKAKERKKEIEWLKANIKVLNEKLFKLLDGCRHRFVKQGESAVCDTCGEDGGWWCPQASKHVCVYEDDSEYCTHCGLPEERK